MTDKPNAAGRDTGGDWPEDFAHENGNYSCTCADCKRVFHGHKRRVVCKRCATPAAPTPMDFIYKLNAMENAGAQTNAFKAGYKEKRQAVLDHVAELERTLARAIKEIEALKRGEYICRQCGLRKDGEHEKGDF